MSSWGCLSKTFWNHCSILREGQKKEKERKGGSKTNNFCNYFVSNSFAHLDPDVLVRSSWQNHSRCVRWRALLVKSNFHILSQILNQIEVWALTEAFSSVAMAVCLASLPCWKAKFRPSVEISHKLKQVFFYNYPGFPSIHLTLIPDQFPCWRKAST